MINAVNTPDNSHAIENAGTSLEQLENISGSNPDMARDFERAKKTFLKYVGEAKKNLSLMADASAETARVDALEQRFAKVEGKFKEKMGMVESVKTSQQQAVLAGLDSKIPLTTKADEEKESEDGGDDEIEISDDRTYRKPMKEAYEAYQSKNYKVAMPLFEKAAGLAKGLKRMEKFAEGIFMRSQCIFDQDKFSDARKAFESVESVTKTMLSAEGMEQWHYGAIIRKGLSAYNLRDNTYAAKIFLDEKLMERALPYEDPSNRAAAEQVIADLKERVGKKGVSKG